MELETHYNQNAHPIAGGTFFVSVNEKGRMTLPSKVRQMLRLSAEPSTVEMQVQTDGTVSIRGKLLTVAETAGAVTPLTPTRDWKEIEAIAREDVAQRHQPEAEQ